MTNVSELANLIANNIACEPECMHSGERGCGCSHDIAKAILAAYPALAAQQNVRRPHKETIAREIRRAMLDNPTDAGFNARAEKREKIADATADAILKLFTIAEQSPRRNEG